MSTLLDTVGSLINAAFGTSGWVSKVITCITAEGNEILVVGFVLSISGFAIGAIRRLCKLG